MIYYILVSSHKKSLKLSSGKHSLLGQSYELIGVLGYAVALYNPYQSSSPDNVWYKVGDDGSSR